MPLVFLSIVSGDGTSLSILIVLTVSSEFYTGREEKSGPTSIVNLQTAALKHLVLLRHYRLSFRLLESEMATIFCRKEYIVLNVDKSADFF